MQEKVVICEESRQGWVETDVSASRRGNLIEFISLCHVSRETRGGRRTLLARTPLSDFANDYHNMGHSFPNSNAKNFLTKTIFTYLMVGNIIPSRLQKD
jgi:hypothetical protein